MKSSTKLRLISLLLGDFLVFPSQPFYCSVIVFPSSEQISSSDLCVCRLRPGSTQGAFWLALSSFYFLLSISYKRNRVFRADGKIVLSGRDIGSAELSDINSTIWSHRKKNTQITGWKGSDCSDTIARREKQITFLVCYWNTRMVIIWSKRCAGRIMGSSDE